MYPMSVPMGNGHLHLSSVSHITAASKVVQQISAVPVHSTEIS